MPKDRRKRLGAHAPSVKLSKRQFAADGQAEQVQIGSVAEGVSANDILEAITTPSDLPQLKKKEKERMKHEAFIQRLESTQTPYSKSHNRRMKRKAKEQVAGGLASMHEALALLVPEDDSTPNDASQLGGSSGNMKNRPKTGQIGQGKGATLTKSQRKRALELEKLRQPLILSTPEFAANPFQTIRTHASNSLLKHNTPVT